MQWLKSFLLSILTTCLLSILIFIASVSMITHRFPPDMAKLKATFQNTQKILAVSQKFMAQTNWEEVDQKLTQQQQAGGLEGAVANVAGHQPQPPSAPPVDYAKRIVELEMQNASLQTRVEYLESQFVRLNAALKPAAVK